MYHKHQSRSTQVSCTTTTFSISKSNIPSHTRRLVFHCESSTHGSTLFFFKQVLKSLTASLFLDNFYKRHRSELRYAFYSPLIPQKQKLQEKSHYYKTPEIKQSKRQCQYYSYMELEIQLRLFTVTASDDFAQDVTILQHTGQAHTLRFTEQEKL